MEKITIFAGLCLLLCHLGSTVVPPTTFCSGKSDGNYVNTNDATTFYQCSGGVTYIQKCPANLVYKASCNCCDSPQSTSAGSTFCSGKSDGNYVNTNDATTFYQCSGGVTNIQKCPANLVYKASCNCCDSPQSTSTGSTFCSGKSDGNYVNTNDATTFYQCSGGVTNIQKCPANLVYKASCNCCDSPQSTSTGTTFCSGKSDGNYVNTNDATTFYQCSGGVTYIQKCPANLVYMASCNCCK